MANWYKPHYKIIYRLQDKTFVSRLGRYRFFSDRRVRRFLRWKKGGVGRHLRGFASMKWYKQRFFFGLKFFNFSTKKRRKVRYFHHNSLYKVGLDRKKGFLSFFRKFDDSKVRKWFKEYYNNSKSFKMLNFLRIFESRLDVICFRLKLMPTIFLANSYIKSRGLSINQSKTFVPSYMLQLGDMLHFGEASLWRFFSNKFLEKLWKRWHRFNDLNLTRKKTKYLFYRELLNKNSNIRDAKAVENLSRYTHLFNNNWWLKTQGTDVLDSVINFHNTSNVKSKANLFLFNILYLKSLKSVKLTNYLKLLKSLGNFSKSSKKNILVYYLTLFLKKKMKLNNSLIKVFLFYKKLNRKKMGGSSFKLKGILNLKKILFSKFEDENFLLQSRWNYRGLNKTNFKGSLVHFAHLNTLKRDYSITSLSSFFNFMKNFKVLIEVLFLNFFFKKNSYRFLFLKIWHKVSKFYGGYSAFFKSLLNLLKLTFSLRALTNSKNTSKQSRFLLFKYFDLRFKFFNKSNELFFTFKKEFEPFIKLLKTFLLPFSYEKSLQLVNNSNYLYNTYYEDFDKAFNATAFLKLVEQHQIVELKPFTLLFYEYSVRFFSNNYSFSILKNSLKGKGILSIITSFFELENLDFNLITIDVLKKVCWKMQVFSYNHALTLIKDNLNVESLLLNERSTLSKVSVIDLSFFKSAINSLEVSKNNNFLDINMLKKNNKSLRNAIYSLEGSDYNAKVTKKLYEFFVINHKVNSKKIVKSKNFFKYNRIETFSKHTYKYNSLEKFLNKSLIFYWDKSLKVKHSLLSKWAISLPRDILQKGFTKNYKSEKKRVFGHNNRLKLRTSKPRQFSKKFSLYKRVTILKYSKTFLYNKRRTLLNKRLFDHHKMNTFSKKIKFVGKKFNWKLKKQQKLYNRFFGFSTKNQDHKNFLKGDPFYKSHYLRWKLFGSNYKLSFFKKKYRFFYWGNTFTEYFHYNTKIFASYWFAKRYKKLIPFLFKRIHGSYNKPTHKYLSPKNKVSKSTPKFHLPIKKRSEKFKLFLKSSLKNPSDSFLFSKFQFLIKKRRRIIKRYRFKFGFKRLRKTVGRRRKSRKLSSYKKYNKHKEKYLFDYLRNKYDLGFNSSEFDRNTFIRNKIYFYKKLDNIRHKLRTFYNIRRQSLLFNEIFLYENLLEGSNVNVKKGRLILHNNKLGQNMNLIKARNKDLYNLLLNNKFENNIKYSLKSRSRAKKWWERSKNKKIIFPFNISKQKGLFYGLFLKRNRLKRYKKFFWYRQRWNWNSILTKSYQWRSKLLSINKIRKQRKIKFTNIRVKPLLILPSSIEFDFVSFRALMISFPNLEASLTGGSSTSYFYSLVNFYQRLGL